MEAPPTLEDLRIRELNLREIVSSRLRAPMKFEAYGKVHEFPNATVFEAIDVMTYLILHAYPKLKEDDLVMMKSGLVQALDLLIQNKRPPCPKCGNGDYIKDGHKQKESQQWYRCKICGNRFVLGIVDAPKKELTVDLLKAEPKLVVQQDGVIRYDWNAKDMSAKEPTMEAK